MREEKKREILLSMFDGVHSTSELVDQAYQYGVEQGREEAINTVENHIEMLGTGVSINVTLRLREMQGKERKKEMLEDLSTPTTDE